MRQDYEFEASLGYILLSQKNKERNQLTNQPTILHTRISKFTVAFHQVINTTNFHFLMVQKMPRITKKRQNCFHLLFLRKEI